MPLLQSEISTRGWARSDRFERRERLRFPPKEIWLIRIQVLLGECRSDTLVTTYNLATLLRTQGRFEEATEVYKKVPATLRS